MEKTTKNQIIYSITLALAFLAITFIQLVWGSNTKWEWMIYGALVGIIAMLQIRMMKTQKNDERTEFIASKTMSITFMFTIMGIVTVIFIDRLTTITIPYASFMGYFLFYVLTVHFITRRILLKKH